jgi:hypothetical protein
MGYTTEQRVGLGVSIALHLLVAMYLLRAPVLPVPQTSAIDVTFEPPKSPARKQQIVSPPQNKAEKPPLNTERISDVDATAVKEQINRGTEGGIPNQPAKPQPPMPETKSQPERESAPKEQPARSEPPVKPPPVKQPAAQSNAHKELNLKDLNVTGLPCK